MRQNRFICFKDDEGRLLFVPFTSIACVREVAPAVGVLQLVNGNEYRLNKAADAVIMEIETIEREEIEADIELVESAIGRAVAGVSYD